uniref:Uncharacterized protein n=1 Tax=Anguilla anguilla TaxID=7936 RepID=A0A0E9Y0S8_ANGAN
MVSLESPFSYNVSSSLVYSK